MLRSPIRHWVATTARAPASTSGRGEPFHPFAHDGHAPGGAARGEHHEVGVEPERGEIRGREEAVLALTRRERERGAGQGGLVHQRVGGEVDDAVAVERRVP